MGHFYPSCVVNLRLRFDESFQIDPDMPAPLLRDGGQNVVADPSPKAAKRPLFTQIGKQQLSFVQNRVPRSAQVTLPAYRQAGKFELELDWRELPIDPRLLRAIGIEIYFGTVSPDDFASGMISVENGVRRSVLATKDAAGATRDDLLALVGFVDTWSVTHTDQGSSVHMSGRDIRGLFLDSPINPDVVAKVDLGRPLPFVIADILRHHPASADMKILYNPQDWPDGVPPSVADKEGLTRVRQGADSQGGGGDSGQSDAPNFWDIVTRYCFLVGAIPFFRGRNLIIRPSRAIFDQSKPQGQEPQNAALSAISSSRVARERTLAMGGGLVGFDASTWDPVFETPTRVDDEGKEFAIRKFIYGRNVKELTFERKFTGTKCPLIEVVSYDTSSKNRGGDSKLLIETWPPADATLARISGVYPSGLLSQTDKIQVPVPGIRDRTRLQAIARALYEEIGRGELGGSCKTGFLASFKGGNSDPDVCRLRPGHSIEFSFDARQLAPNGAPAASTELQLHRASFDEAVTQVRKTLGGTDENLARALVASSRSQAIGLLRVFRTANVVFSWSQSEGLQTSFDFQNYVVARQDVSQPLGPNKAPAVQTVIARTPKITAKVPQPQTTPKVP